MKTNQPTFILRRGTSPSRDMQVGDAVETYQPIRPFDHITFDPEKMRDSPGDDWDSHAAASQWETRVTADRKAHKGRELQQWLCVCPTSPRIALEYLDGQGIHWFVIGKERIPAAFRTVPEATGGRRAMPFHEHPNGSPHIEMTTCPKCNRVWAVVCTSQVMEAVEVRASWGGTVRA